MLGALRQTLHNSAQPYHISSECLCQQLLRSFMCPGFTHQGSGTPQQAMFMPLVPTTTSQSLPRNDMVARLSAVLSLHDTWSELSVSPIVHALSAAPPLRHRAC